MGATSSSGFYPIATAASNPLLQRLCSNQSIPFSDPFWADLLSFSLKLPLTMKETIELETTLQPLFKSMADNALATHNFGTLLLLLFTHVRLLKEHKGPEAKDMLDPLRESLLLRTCNALLLIRAFTKYFFENLSTENALLPFVSVPVATASTPDHAHSQGLPLQRQNSAGSSSEQQSPGAAKTRIDLSERLVLCLLDLLLDQKELSPALEIEIINLFVVLLSLQLTIATVDHNHFLRIAMIGTCRQRSHELVQYLLHNFVNHAEAQPEVTANSVIESIGNAVESVTSAAGSLLWLPVSALSFVVRSTIARRPAMEADEMTARAEKSIRNDFLSDPLAESSLLLLLLLCNHAARQPGGNPYMKALFSFCDTTLDFTNSGGAPPFGVFKESYAKLYGTICRRLHNQQTTLLLYLLLHGNTSFTSFILSRTDLENLIIPLLKMLYETDQQQSEQIYMLLIILLILSQDNSFNKCIHEQTIPSAPWYKDRQLRDISLGSLVVAVLIRVVLYNLNKFKDLYMNTNCLAALANMSPHFHSLHPYAAEKLIRLFSVLSKKFESYSVKSGQDTAQSDDARAEASIFADFLRMMLEIINACLSNSLQRNPYLVYMLLLKREIFDRYATLERFADLVSNIETVLDHFDRKLKERNFESLTAEKVLEVIEQGSLQWHSDKIKKPVDLAFRYEEEEQPDDFFIPYVWSLATTRALVHWRTAHDTPASSGTAESGAGAPSPHP